MNLNKSKKKLIKKAREALINCSWNSNNSKKKEKNYHSKA